jgi:oxalate decarboxylase/phosphoglucose isomerase-like protein (cupin superfamily)
MGQPGLESVAGLRTLHWRRPWRDGRCRTERLQKGYVGYIAQRGGHSIENVGSGPARILIGFNAETMERSQWIAANPKDVLATNFGPLAENSPTATWLSPQRMGLAEESELCVLENVA